MSVAFSSVLATISFEAIETQWEDEIMGSCVQGFFMPSSTACAIVGVDTRTLSSMLHCSNIFHDGCLGLGLWAERHSLQMCSTSQNRRSPLESVVFLFSAQGR